MDTITARHGYRVWKPKDGGNKRVVTDGETPILVAELKSSQEYLEERKYNECFMFCEKFTTVRGMQYIYWRDDEIDEDYLTKTDGRC